MRAKGSVAGESIWLLEVFINGRKRSVFSGFAIGLEHEFIIFSGPKWCSFENNSVPDYVEKNVWHIVEALDRFRKN